ncbi:MAG: hypothetical protein K5649_00930 [Lachnospiraceae bacterium]|nr:hypothetical protein [Lachnospiraceae bacterium]
MKQMIVHYFGKKYKASMTVELTLLMPLILGVFLFLLFTMYYLHDITAIQKGCETALTRGMLERNDEAARAEMEKALEEIRLLGIWDIDRKAVVGKDRVSVSVSGIMRIREGLFLKLIRGSYSYEKDEEARRVDEVVYLRSHGR